MTMMMMRMALPLSLAAALGLSACGSEPRKPAPPAQSSAPAPTQSSAYRPGSGVVQSVAPAPRMASAGGSAPATTTRGDAVTAPGSSAGASAAPMHRLAIRMDDGTVQYVDMAGPEVPPVGSRVQLTPDRQIIRMQ
jgi:hypothetical protein